MSDSDKTQSLDMCRYCKIATELNEVLERYDIKMNDHKEFKNIINASFRLPCEHLDDCFRELPSKFTSCMKKIEEILST